MSAIIITKDVVIDAPVQKVWKALTDTTEMKKWYFDIASFEPKVGHEFDFWGTEGCEKKYHHLCKVTEAVPEKKLAYTWVYENKPGSTLLTWEFQEEGDKTRVKLTHEGIESFSSLGKDFTQESFTGGWTYFLEDALPKYVKA